MVAFADRDRQLVVPCKYCGAEYVLWVNEKDFLEWANGSPNDVECYIQNKLPYLSANERELLISGTCGSCWDNRFVHFEEDEEDV